MMRILCTLPNASAIISGVAFSPNPDGPGLMSGEITQEVAARFLAIPGYQAVAPVVASTDDPTAEEAPRASRRARGQPA